MQLRGDADGPEEAHSTAVIITAMVMYAEPEPRGCCRHWHRLRTVTARSASIGTTAVPTFTVTPIPVIAVWNEARTDGAIRIDLRDVHLTVLGGGEGSNLKAHDDASLGD